MIYFFCNIFYCLGFMASFLCMAYAQIHINVSAFNQQRADIQVRHQSFTKLIWINAGPELAFSTHTHRAM